MEEYCFLCGTKENVERYVFEAVLMDVIMQLTPHRIIENFQIWDSSDKELSETNNLTFETKYPKEMYPNHFFLNIWNADFATQVQ